MENTQSANFSEKDRSSSKEGPIAKGIEKQTAKIPSDVFLWAAVGSMAIAAAFKLLGKKHTALFVGQWAAPFLLLGLYNKLVKIAGHDWDESEREKKQVTENQSGSFLRSD